MPSIRDQASAAKLLLALACLLLLDVGDGPGPGITVNNTDGIVFYSLVGSHGESDRAAALAMAAKHFTRYGKYGSSHKHPS
jgi:hypothetical protein